MDNFTSEQQAAINVYNNAKQKGQEKGVWNTDTQKAAREVLQKSGVGVNSNGFFSINGTQTATSGTTTKPTQQVSQNQNNETVQTTVSNQNNTNNQTVQQQGALKPLSQEYYNQSNAESQNTIVSNLNNYRQTNPEYFSDYQTFKNNFSYDARNDVQKQTLDTWYKGYQRGVELNTKAVSDLATQYKNGLISDADLEQLRATNNGKYAEVMQYVNKQAILSKYDEETNIASSDNPFQAIIDQYYANLLSASQTNASSEMFNNYKNQMNSPEMTEMSDQLADLDGQIKEYQSELNRIKSDVERRYEGTGASKTKINAIIADESYKIQEAMNTANIQYNTLANKYNSRMSQYQNEFQLELQEYQFNMQQRNQQMQELGFIMDLMNFETNAQKEEREWNQFVRQYDYQYGNINSKDYASRRKAVDNAVQDVLNEFSGITMIRSKDQMVEDIMNLVDGGMSLGEAITKNIREPIMQKPEYKVWKSQQYGTGGVSIGGSSYTIDSNGNLVLNGTSSGSTNYYNLPDYEAVTEGYKEYTLNSYVNDPNNKQGMIGGQCGSFVNDYLETLGIGRLYKDPIDSKLAVTNTNTPTKGSIAVVDWRNSPNASDDQKKYGHVAIVTGINGNKIEVLESNHGGDRKIYKSTYDISQISGFFDPSISKNQAIQSAQQTQSQSQAYNVKNPYDGISGYTSNGTEINAGGWISSLEDQYGKKRASNDERSATLQAYGIDVKEFNEQKQRYAKYFEQVQLVENAQKMYDDIQELLTWNEDNSSSGGGSRHKGRIDMNTYYYLNGDTDNYKPIFGYDKITANGINMYNLIKNNQMLDRYLELKGNGAQFGVMTNSEWGIVGSTTNKLNWISSDAEFEKTLRELQNNYKSIIESNGGKVQSNTPQQNIDMSSMQNTGTIIQSNGVYTKTVNGKTMYSNDGVNWY